MPGMKHTCPIFTSMAPSSGAFCSKAGTHREGAAQLQVGWWLGTQKRAVVWRQLLGKWCSKQRGGEMHARTEVVVCCYQNRQAAQRHQLTAAASSAAHLC